MWLLENVVYRYSQYDKLNEMKNKNPELKDVIVVKETTVKFYNSLLYKMIDDYKSSLDEKTTIQILQSHGRFKECLEFAEKLGKYEEIILNFINEKQHGKAIEKITSFINHVVSNRPRSKQNDPSEKKAYEQSVVAMVDFILKHSKALILNSEAGYLEVLNELHAQDLFILLDNNKKIEIVNYLMDLKDEKVIKEAKSFLEKLKDQIKSEESKGASANKPSIPSSFIVQTAKDAEARKSISNIIIYLLSKIKNPDALEEHLIEIETKGKQEVDFDLNFAMLLCQERSELRRCEIVLYGMMDLYEEAVNLALNNKKGAVHIDLAKKYASRPVAKSVKSNLWIKIAKSQMSIENEVNKLLKEHPEDLKIEDLIPYFDDHIRISSFRDQICDSLTRYNNEIQTFKKDMNQYSKNAEFLKKEMSELRNRYHILEQEKTCDSCGSSIFKDVFYYFPCGHAFLKRCLKEMLAKENMEQRLGKISILEDSIKEIMKKADARAASRNEQLTNKSPYLRKLENLTPEETKMLHEFYVGLCV